MDTLMTVLTVAGCSFLICVPGNDDVMLSYQSLSFHDALALRAMLGVRAAPEFEAWLCEMGLQGPDGSIRALAEGPAALVHRLAGAGLAA
jgi:ethanolamine ammonia-lyase large subunit